MSNFSSAGRNQPPSSLASGRFLTLLAFQLIAVGLGLGISRHAYNVGQEVLGRYEHLVHSRQQVDLFSARLDHLLQTVQRLPSDEKQTKAISAELDSTTASAQSLLDFSQELPNETEGVRQSVAGLNNAWQNSCQNRRGPAQAHCAADLSTAILRLKQALNALHGGVGQLEEVNLGRIEAIQPYRLWSVAFQALAWLLIAFAIGYVIQLYRHLHKEELARFLIESELSAERAALEKRVQARTAALQAEVQERQRVEQLNRGRNHMLEMVARNEPITEILQVLAYTLAEHRSTWICAIHTLDSGVLKLAASSGLNNKVKQHLCAISTEFAGAPESVALASGKPHLIEDLGAERKTWSELLRANGLLSVWSAPFFASNSSALGTITIYTLLKWNPTANGY